MINTWNNFNIQLLLTSIHVNLISGYTCSNMCFFFTLCFKLLNNVIIIMGKGSWKVNQVTWNYMVFIFPCMGYDTSDIFKTFKCPKK
jgi:hypothetical protein